jgi:hypothetical protein
VNTVEFSKPYLVALYTMNKAQSNVAANVGEIISKFLVQRDDYFEGEIVEYLTHQGWVRTSAGAVDPTAPMIITTSGKIYAEALISEGVEVLDLNDWIDDHNDQTSAITEVPAADRIVTLGHNSEAHAEVKAGIGDLKEALRSTNDIPIDGDERQRLIAGLEAAELLWDAAQLKLIQIKIGVIMAVEDARKVLAGTAKAVVGALVVDAIKSLVKNQLGIDVDSI